MSVTDTDVEHGLAMDDDAFLEKGYAFFDQADVTEPETADGTEQETQEAQSVTTDDQAGDLVAAGESDPEPEETDATDPVAEHGSLPEPDHENLTDTTPAPDTDETLAAGDTPAPSADETLQQIFAPFKANGREMQVQTADEALQLMQMGANYHFKMSKMKPHLKTVRTLEKHEINEEKLNFLIALDKGDKQAIAKLIKDNEFDNYSDDHYDENYKPESYAVSDKQVELDTVLDELSSSPAYDKTIDIIGSQWDSDSRNEIAQRPHHIAVLDSHVQTGIYDQITQEVTRLKTFGQLQGMNDLQAYEHVGQQLLMNGQLQGMQAAQSSSSNTEPKTVAPKQAKPINPELTQKKRAASPTRNTAKSKPKIEFNPLEMSDEEFAKLGLANL